MSSKFHERFDIDVNVQDARSRFVNRIYNRVFLGFFYKLNDDQRYRIHREVITVLGDKYSFHKSLSDQVGEDFFRNLQALETLYHALPYYHEQADSLINLILKESEVDLGIRWEDGRFIKTGAKLLDEKLVNDVLHWLRDKNYESVVRPFEKGLDHFLHSEKRPELLSDVVTDMYEALEALAKIITGRSNKDLSANREVFISKVNASPEYKKLLAEYIVYANEFRHAAEEGKKKPNLSVAEVESFIYLTGVFMRLAIQ